MIREGEKGRVLVRKNSILGVDRGSSFRYVAVMGAG